MTAIFGTLEGNRFELRAPTPERGIPNPPLLPGSQGLLQLEAPHQRFRRRPFRLRGPLVPAGGEALAKLVHRCRGPGSRPSRTHAPSKLCEATHPHQPERSTSLKSRAAGGFAEVGVPDVLNIHTRHSVRNREKQRLSSCSRSPRVRDLGYEIVVIYAGNTSRKL